MLKIALGQRRVLRLDYLHVFFVCGFSSNWKDTNRTESNSQLPWQEFIGCITLVCVRFLLSPERTRCLFVNELHFPNEPSPSSLTCCLHIKNAFLKNWWNKTRVNAWNTYVLLIKREVKMAWYWRNLFWRFYGPRRSQGPKTVEKEWGCYLAILTEQALSIKDLLYSKQIRSNTNQEWLVDFQS